MDAHDIFVKLVRGARFTNTRNKSNSSQSAPQSSVVKDESKIVVKAESTKNDNIKETAICKTENDDTTMTLLGSITATQSGQTKKRKKKGKVLTDGLKAKLEQEKINRYRNENNISVVGRHVAPAISCFEELASVYNLNPLLLDNLKKSGYDSPTAIQKQALPAMLQKRQILGCAPTGSGKTAAFLVPLLHHLGGAQNKGFRAVILCPTRELAKQILRECLRLGEGTGLRPHFIYKAQEGKKYSEKSFLKFDLLITTPKRLCFLLAQDPVVLSLNNVEWLVVDEADKLFEGGVRSFRDQLDGVLRACAHQDRKMAMFSATHTPAVAKWARHNMKGLVNITVGQRNQAAEGVDQELMFVGDESGKLLALRDLVRRGIRPPVLVFVQSKERAQELFTELIYDGINVDVIHADRTQTQRDNVVRAFREGRVWVLICTELMGRGVDFRGVNLVLNYDFPNSAIAYVHRIGRTGRAGQRGRAVTFYTRNDVVNLRSIAQVLHASGCKVPEYMLTLKKTSKKDKKQLQKSAPKRDGILTVPLYETNKSNKRRRLEKANLDKVGMSSSDEDAPPKPMRPPKTIPKNNDTAEQKGSSNLNTTSQQINKNKKLKRKGSTSTTKGLSSSGISKKTKRPKLTQDAVVN